MKDAFYFPHFSNARHDRKIKRLTKEIGIEGYAIYFMLLEVLRDQIDFRYPIQDLDLLADEFGTSEQKVRVVICNYQLFNVDEDNKFFSMKFNEFMQPYLNMKEQRRLAGIKSAEARKTKLLQLPFNDRSTTVEEPFNEIQQSKPNETNKDINTLCKKDIQQRFDDLWKLYPHKVGKGQISDSKKKHILDKVGYEQFARCIERYKKYVDKRKETFPEFQYQNGSTFFNSGYKDYLDDDIPEIPKPIHKPVTIEWVDR